MFSVPREMEREHGEGGVSLVRVYERLESAGKLW